MPTGGGGDVGDHLYMDERDLDSERSEDEDREKKDPYDIEYED